MKPSLSLLLIFLFSTCIAQKDELFAGQNKLQNCEIIMKITGKRKNDQEDKKFADSLKDVEIVWIIIDKNTRKSKIPNPQRVFLVSDSLKSGVIVEYFVPVEIYKDRDRKQREAIFPTWSATRANKYYRADCYDQAMKEWLQLTLAYR